MTIKAIDPWVNVSMGAMADTPFLQKVKEYKGSESTEVELINLNIQ